MTSKRLFIQYYSTDATKYEDKKKFRDRMVKYLHDAINEYDPKSTQKLCRQQMGITIPALPNSNNLLELIYVVESEFSKIDTKINDILDLITVTYDSWDHD